MGNSGDLLIASICFIFVYLILGLAAISFRIHENKRLITHLPVALFSSYYITFLMGASIYFFNLPYLVTVIIIGIVAIPLCYRSLSKTNLKFIDTIAITTIIGLFMMVTPEPIAAFSTWDSVVSWNRWATDLTRDIFVPVNAAYPIFFPVVWSVIYGTTGNPNLEYLSSLAMLVCYFAVIFPIATMLIRKMYIEFVVTCSCFYFIILQIGKYPTLNIVSGCMDAPVTFLLLGALLYTLLHISNNMKIRTDYLCAMMLFGIAGATKQAGFVGLLFVIAYNYYIYLNLGKSSFKQILFGTSIALTPALIYFLMYVLNSDNSLTGNYQYLTTLADRRQQPIDSLYTLYSEFARVFHPAAVWAFIVSLITQLIFLKYRFAKIGLFVSIISMTTAYIYYDCCSYNARNGWWNYALITFSMLCAIRAIIKSLFQISTTKRYFDLMKWLEEKRFNVAIPRPYNKLITLAAIVLTIISVNTALNSNLEDGLTEMENRGGKDTAIELARVVKDDICAVVFASSMISAYNPLILSGIERSPIPFNSHSLVLPPGEKRIYAAGFGNASFLNFAKKDKGKCNVYFLMHYNHHKQPQWNEMQSLVITGELQMLLSGNESQLIEVM